MAKRQSAVAEPDLDAITGEPIEPEAPEPDEALLTELEVMTRLQ